MKKGWTAVRRGKIYCAPLCGSGCTFAEFQRAKRLGEKLRQRLGSKMWRVEVWENLGWHPKVVHATLPYLEVYINEYKGKFSYWADTCVGGRQFHADHADPHKAVQAAIAKALEKFSAMGVDIALIDAVGLIPAKAKGAKHVK